MAVKADPSKLQGYVAKTKETEYAYENTEPETEYALRINKTFRSLQNQVKQHEAAIDKLRATIPAVAIDEPSQDRNTRIQQLRLLTTTYKALAPTKPLLPQANSPLPALLALRSTLNLVDQNKMSIRKTLQDITETRAKLHGAEDDLKDAHATTHTLEKKIQVLTGENERQLHDNPQTLAKAVIQEEQHKRRIYIRGLRKLVKGLNSFVDRHLAAMLAAEDLDGPLVGDLVDVDEDVLKSGFNKHGRPRNLKANGELIEAERRRRNEEIWGSVEGNFDHERSEREAAAADFRSLTEDLLNASAGDEGSNPYIDISRESAAVRFLVRVKVAQFHPDDARQLRLVDFGRELNE